jgi:hypothetical protein
MVQSSPLPENVENVLFAVWRVIIHLAVDFGNFIAPATALGMLHIHNVIMRPMEIVGDEANLLIQPVNRVT